MRDSPVYARPDDESAEVAEVHAGYWIIVLGTTPKYLEVRLKSLAVGFIPCSAVHVVHGFDYFERCFRVGPDAEVTHKPNSHSSTVAAVTAGSQVTILGRALADYVYVRTAQGDKGYLKRGELSGEVTCPSEEGAGY